jgi:hypothetical protein
LQLVRDAHVSGDLIAGESHEVARELRGPPRGRLRADDCEKTGAALAHMIPSIAACFGAAIGNDADLQHKQ